MNPGYEMRGALIELGLTGTQFARLLGDLGDVRPEDQRCRWVRRLTDPRAKRMPGEVAALLEMMRRAPGAWRSLPSMLAPLPPPRQPLKLRKPVQDSDAIQTSTAMPPADAAL